jgi:hypothetical protein
MDAKGVIHTSPGQAGRRPGSMPTDAHRALKARFILAEASPGSGWKEFACINRVLKKSVYEQGYPHVVFCDGKILCRNMEGNLVCLSVRNDH